MCEWQSSLLNLYQCTWNLGAPMLPQLNCYQPSAGVLHKSKEERLGAWVNFDHNCCVKIEGFVFGFFAIGAYSIAELSRNIDNTFK